MKVIGFEEHYKLPAIQEANRDNPGELVYDVWKKAGRFETDAQGGGPAGLYDLGEGRCRYGRGGDRRADSLGSSSSSRATANTGR